MSRGCHRLPGRCCLLTASPMIRGREVTLREADESMEVGEGFAGGKVILVGEHAVVHGHPALVAGIALGVRPRVQPRRAGLPTWLRIARWSIDGPLDRTERLGQAILAMLAALGLAEKPLAIDGEPELPAGVGLGSSASLSVSLARALLRLTGEPQITERVEQLALLAESCFHGRASGVDVAAASRGGLLFFRTGQPVEPVAAPRPLPLLLVLTPAGPCTAELVARVGTALAQEPGRVGGTLQRLGELARQARQAVLDSCPAALGATLDEAHGLLAGLGLSTAEVERAVATARAAGALGAKLSGAGGGGVVLVLPGDDPARLAGALREAGFTVLETMAGGNPAAPASRSGPG